MGFFQKKVQQDVEKLQKATKNAVCDVVWSVVDGVLLWQLSEYLSSHCYHHQCHYVGPGQDDTTLLPPLKAS